MQTFVRSGADLASNKTNGLAKMVVKQKSEMRIHFLFGLHQGYWEKSSQQIELKPEGYRSL